MSHVNVINITVYVASKVPMLHTLLGFFGGDNDETHRFKDNLPLKI